MSEDKAATTTKESLVKADFSEHRIFKSHIDPLISAWDEREFKDFDRNRKSRELSVDIDALRKTGELDQEETIIPSRVINRNIQQSMPTFISYLGSNRVAIFNDVVQPGSSAEKICEREFSRIFKFEGWQNEFHGYVDGAHLNGWDWMEVMYDDTAPGHFRFEHVGSDNLIFMDGLEDIQAAPFIARRRTYSYAELLRFVDEFDWDVSAVNQLVGAGRDNSMGSTSSPSDSVAVHNRVYIVYRILYKDDDGVVQTAFYSKDSQEWLAKPAQLYIGVDVPTVSDDGSVATAYVARQETSYPFVPYVYLKTENKEIRKNKGRAFHDLPAQDAETALGTNLVNGSTRASNIYAAPDNNNIIGDGTPEILTNTKLVPKAIYNNALKFFSPPYPDSVLLSAINTLGARNEADSGNVDFAANNRKDSRKTATEIESAETKSAELNTVQISLFSISMLRIVTICWEIAQSRALQNLIPFAVESEMGNRIDIISRSYYLQPAADQDVIQRRKVLMQMRNDMAIVTSTAAATAFLARYFRLSYPEDGETYASLIEQGGTAEQAQGQAAIQVLQGILQEESVRAAIPPDLIPQIQQIVGTPDASNNG